MHANPGSKDISPPSPSQIPLKWPLTRAERIRELERLAPFYESNAPKNNILTARAYHAQFPVEELVPAMRVFCNGQIVDRSKMRLSEGPTWREVWICYAASFIVTYPPGFRAVLQF